MEIKVYGDVHVLGEITDDYTGLKIHKVKKRVKLRDKGCVVCGRNDESLRVHHIFPKSLYPSLSSDEANMVCLCQKHHDRYHESVELRDCNPLTFIQFLKENEVK